MDWWVAGSIHCIQLVGLAALKVISPEMLGCSAGALNAAIQ
jgi:hypothetical protein